MQMFVPLSVPNLNGNEKLYMNEAIDTEWVSTAGPFVQRFEKEIAEYVNVSNAVACQSGTSGLHLALLNLGINKNHEVIVPTLTFIAAINPVKYVGAEPIFMDCDDSLCIDPIKIQEFINQQAIFDGDVLINKSTNKVIKAMIVVHVFGNMCDMEKLYEISRKYNISIIEDATEALGTKYVSGSFQGEFAGTIGHAGVYSFNGNKIITTGGGGMVVSKNKRVIDDIRYLSTQAKNDEVFFIHDEIGYNYRMTNIQAALGVAQLEQLNDFIRIKQENYITYQDCLDSINSLRLLGFRDGTHPNYWFYSILIEDECNITNREMISRLADYKIQARPVWGLIHQQRQYLNSQKYKIEKAQYYGTRIVNVPCSTNLTKEDIKYISQVIKTIVENK